MTDASTDPSEAACRDIVERDDPDRAVSVLFAPADRRPALRALYAFDLETASVRDRVSQPLPGEIRLQWWRDTLAEGRSAAGGAPIAVALLTAIAEHDLPVAAIDRLLDARIFDLYDDPMPSRIAFEAYAGETSATIVMLAAMILDRAAVSSITDVAGHAGVAQTVETSLRNLERHRRRSQIYVPAEILESTGASADAWLAAPSAPTAVADAMLAYGLEHYHAVESGYGSVPATLRPAFLPTLLLPRRLARFGAPRPIGPAARSWTYWRGMRGHAPRAKGDR